MVISRSDAKKRRKEGDALEDSLQGSPKRTKVHAQRKFAQGSSNVNSPALTPVKDKDKVKTNGTVLSPELIPSKRPKTEDFLTFLCFRGTPILPPQLDFFNVATVQDIQDDEQCSSAGDCSASRAINVPNVSQKSQKSAGAEQATTSGMAKKHEKIDYEPKKKPTTAVQALRKKYQEQRLAKQRASTLSKLAQKVKGKNMVRTRSSALREEIRPRDNKSKKPVLKKPAVKNVMAVKKLKPLKYVPMKRVSARGQPKSSRETDNSSVRRGGLRSSGQLPPGSDEGLKNERVLPSKLSSREHHDKTKSKVFVSSLSDFSSDDDQPLVKKTRPVEPLKQSSKQQQLARKMVKRIVKSSRKIRPHMVTRSRQQQQRQVHRSGPQSQPHQRVQQQQPIVPQHVVTRRPSRPTRKTKEAAALYMELLGRKLINPEADGDEDTLSVDSFPELPNAKRNEQRELEIKARHAKEKKEAQQKKENINTKKDASQKREGHLPKKEPSVKKEEVKPEQHEKVKSEPCKDNNEGKGKKCTDAERAKLSVGKTKATNVGKEGASKENTVESKGGKNQKKAKKELQDAVNDKAKVKAEPRKVKGKYSGTGENSGLKSKSGTDAAGSKLKNTTDTSNVKPKSAADVPAAKMKNVADPSGEKSKIVHETSGVKTKNISDVGIIKSKSTANTQCSKSRIVTDVSGAKSKSTVDSSASKNKNACDVSGAKSKVGYDSSSTKSKKVPVGHSLRSRRSVSDPEKVEERESDAEELNEGEEAKPSGPRRSLRQGTQGAQGARDIVIPVLDTPENLLGDGATPRLTIRKGASSSEMPLKKPPTKILTVSVDVAEDKFSDSDEEPLDKIAMKNSANKKIDHTKEDKKKEEVAVKGNDDCAPKVNESPTVNNTKPAMKVAKVSLNSITGLLDSSGNVVIKKIIKKKVVKAVRNTPSSSENLKKQSKSPEDKKQIVSGSKFKDKKQIIDSKTSHNEKEGNEKQPEKTKKKFPPGSAGNVGDEIDVRDKESAPESIASGTSLKSKVHEKKSKEKKADEDTTSVSVDSTVILDKNKTIENIVNKTGNILAAGNKLTQQAKVLLCSSLNDIACAEGLKDTSFQLNEVNVSDKDDTKKQRKGTSPRNEKSDVHIVCKSSQSRKSRGDDSDHKDVPSVHVHPMRKCLVGIESEFRKYSHVNCVQRKGNLSKKEGKGESQRRSSMSCPKETELELQRRLSMVCLKETEPEADEETEKQGTQQKSDESKKRVLGVTLEKDFRIPLKKHSSDSPYDGNKFGQSASVGLDSNLVCNKGFSQLDINDFKSNHQQKCDINESVHSKAGFLFSPQKDEGKTDTGRSIHSFKDFEKNLLTNKAHFGSSTFDAACERLNSSGESEVEGTHKKNLLFKNESGFKTLGSPDKSLALSSSVMKNSASDCDPPRKTSFPSLERSIFGVASLQKSDSLSQNIDGGRSQDVTAPVSAAPSCVQHPFVRLSGQVPLPNSPGPGFLCKNTSGVQTVEKEENMCVMNSTIFTPQEPKSVGANESESNNLSKLCLSVLEVPKDSHTINAGLPSDLGLGDLQAKEKLNMSAERVEKWLSESCTGSVDHKKECSVFEQNVCNCGLSVMDDDLCLPEFSNEKLVPERISGGFDLNMKLTTIVCPGFFSDNKFNQVTSGLKHEVGEKVVTCNIIPQDQTVSSTVPPILKQPSVELKKLSSSSFVRCSFTQGSAAVSVNEGPPKKLVWENSKFHGEQSIVESQRDISEISTDLVSNMSEGSSGKEKGSENVQTLSPGQSCLPAASVNDATKVQNSCTVLEKEKPANGASEMRKEMVKPDTSSISRTVPKLHHVPDRFGEKKSIFQQRRSFPHKVKERKDLTPSANAFSPENESSVYAFETEPESPPINTPFRRRARDSRTSSTTTSKSEEDLLKLAEEEMVSSIAPCVPPVISVTSPVKSSISCGTTTHNPPYRTLQTSANIQGTSGQTTNSRTSTSIAVQVNLDSEVSPESGPQYQTVADATAPEPPPQRSMECSTQTDVAEEDDDESDGHLFYIPLQKAPSRAQQHIQGVAVKLDTEGPTGPNQRVIMRAKLVTKPPNFNRVATSSQDSSLGLKRPRPAGVLMMEQKPPFVHSSSASSSASGTYPPVGTVQPTTRSQPTAPQNKSDATTATVGVASIKGSSALDTSCDESGSVMSSSRKDTESTGTMKSPVGGVQWKQGGRERKPARDGYFPGPSTSTTTPTKTSGSKGSYKERRSSGDTVSPSSAKGNAGNSKRGAVKGKFSKTSDANYVWTPSGVSTFPRVDDPAQLVEAPVFHPSEKEFQDPLEYLEKIRPLAETFGLCRVVPPSNFRPECQVVDDMRFTAYNQYVHKMLHRWGTNVREMKAIKKYMATQCITFTHPPLIGGMELDLPRLYQTVQSFGGLKEVIEKKRWHRVADGMRIPKSAQDRVTKLDDIYCKYLLPYDTLSPVERQFLLTAVDAEWEDRERRHLSQDSSNASDSPEDESDYDIADEECIVKGRTMPLNAFYRIARNTMSMWFRQPEPSASEVEQEFWKHVMTRNSHVCVHSGSIDSSGCGCGFSCVKNSPLARHPWNLKVLSNNSGSILRSMGPIMGVTVPTLHVGMLFTTCCWYRDPHGLPWIEYLHTGASKIWYGIPESFSSVFQCAMSKLVPKYCKNKTIWLPSDTAMVPPSLLVKHGVSLCHTVQEPGQFIIVFPRAFTSSICTGYLVSESVYFAQPSWLSRAEEVFKDIHDSCEPSMFSLERLLFSIALDARSHVDVLRQVLPMILSIRQKEIENRKKLYSLGLKTSERLPLPEANVKRRKIRAAQEEEGEYECEICRANLFVSLVTNSHEEGVYCLPHAIDLLTKKRDHLKYCKLMYTYDQAELNELIQKLQDRIETKSQRKSFQGKHSSSALK